ncbi:efflux RND transporter permease subunit [Paracraurococcus lichenis]|uniref:Efflux RND transporter permease subunit n=1 Tax=Paracraurococcus lichenis TaxID=3064888 RepID=A0ABT9DSE2_9PROT|nr:efflux RND transporter permease subunit [Paracraurococcus sp. LOR1-02]MDO9706808.1 efflux RND transporter permease subunit [Paracraurococcus sp. LOR1-02]
MSISAPFILRPIATALLALGLALAGIAAYFHLPIAPLPRTDIPTIFVGGGLPGADPETTASAVVGPLERRLGAISGITEMTSYSALGAYFIVLQFDLSRNIDAAARDVQQAVNAAGSDLPALPNPPYIRKVNPGDAPVLIMAMAADTVPPGTVYDVADSIVAPRLAQVPGVSQVQIQGAEQPAIRVTIDPAAAKAAGISLETVRQTISQANVTQATGLVDGRDQMAAIHVNDRLTTPEQFGRVIVKQQNGGVVRLSSIGRVATDARDRRQGGSVDGRPAVMMTIFKQADANVIEVVDGIKALMPQIERWMPGGVTITTLRDRTETIRASVHDVQQTLLISIALVVLVVAIFLRRVSAIAATAAAVPLSLLGTLAAMWLCGYSLDNLSLMALTISVGFVVDDAIVMIENMTRLRERGLGAMEAALEGARQIGFTVLSITVSLIAVFIPLLFMGGIVGRMFREFSVVLAIAVAISGVVSLTLTPMMAARMARRAAPPPGRFGRAVEWCMDRMTRGYLWSLRHILRWRRLMLIPTLGLIGVTVWLYVIVPKGFFPDQDTGLIIATTRAAPDTSYQAMLGLQEKVVAVLRKDPAVASVASAIGAGNGNASVSQGRVFLSLKPLEDRPGVSANDVINRLRRPLNGIPGIQTFMRAVQDVGIGGRAGNASIQFVLLSPEIADLQHWSQVLVDRLRTLPQIQDVNSDQQNAGLVTRLVIDREAAARTGVSVAAITSALNSSFSQRQVSVIYRSRNQYRVVLEVEPGLQQYPEQVDDIWLSGSGGVQVPLSSLVKVERSTAPLFITHQGQFPAATITFNLSPDVALSDATAAVEKAAMEAGLPDTMRTEFAGNARAFQSFTRGQPMLILAALVTIYIVLGMLYEHLLHPITILSTLPTAGIGALLALLATNTPFSVIALIAIILLMGIVKKNAIMMVDFALEHEREQGVGGMEAILEACRERFRPILMTTLAAVMGAVPLALSTGPGSELRQPLGIALIGGLLLAQVVTLYTTPVVYLALDGKRKKTRVRVPQAVPAE